MCGIIIGEVRAKPAGVCGADLDADGDCDADDFVAYLDRFSLGC